MNKTDYFQIFQENTGRYHVHFNTDEQGTKTSKEIAERLGHQILYFGKIEYDGLNFDELEIVKEKWKLICNAVDEANKTGKFIPKILEERLKDVEVENE